MPVRLDPWQNIVGVSWDGDGNGGPGPLFPSLAGWSGARNSAPGAALTLGAASAEVGTLLIAQVACDKAPGDPRPQVAIGGPAGWDPLYQQSCEFSAEFGFTQTAGAWARVKEAGDPDDWDWTFSPAAPRTGVMMRIADVRPTGIPEALAVRQSDFSDVALGPSIAPGAANTLLLTLLDADSNFNPFGIYPGDDLQTFEISWRSFGSQNGHVQMVFSEEWPGPGATGTRAVALTPATCEIVAHIAIAPPTP